MNVERPVLILTQPIDVTADYVVDELSQRGTPLFRCDPGDFPLALTLAAELGEGWTGSLRLSERDVPLEEIGCACTDGRPPSSSAMSCALRSAAGRRRKPGSD